LTILITKWALFLVSFGCETQLAARAAWPPVHSRFYDATVGGDDDTIDAEFEVKS
jgi:hypothetical protein